ncbi:hypothetical protein [Streptomyces sp. CA-253872]
MCERLDEAARVAEAAYDWSRQSDVRVLRRHAERCPQQRQRLADPAGY